MDTKALKDKILQLAIQGKLVPQDENDEPASALLKRIKEEKEQLVKDKIIKKEKPLPAITDDEKLFELPSGWEWCRLSDISQVISKGTTPKGGRNAYKSEGVNFLRVENITDDFQINLNNITLIDKSTHDTELKRSIAQEGDLLISIAGSLGRVATVKAEHTPCNMNQAISFVRLVNRQVSVEYLKYFIASPIVKESMISKNKTTAQPNLTLEIISRLVFAVPPLEEQERIVAKVNSLFKLIDELNNNKQDLLQNISDARNKVLQLAIQGKLVYQDENDESVSVLLERIKEEKETLIKDKIIKKEKSLPEITDDEKLFELPKGWEWSRLSDIGQIIGGGTPSSGNPEYYTDDYGIPWLTPADLRGYKEKYISNGDRYITELGLQKSSARMLPKGSVLFSSRAPIGYVVINNEEVCTNQGFKSIVPYIVEMNEYIYYFLKYNTKNIEDRASGTTFKEISGKGMSEIVIPIPPLEEQKRIVSKLETIMNYLDELEKEVN